MNNQQGLFSRVFIYLFGANWKTSAIGFGTLLAYFIHGHPQYLHWISEPLQDIVWQGSEWLFYGGFAAFAKQVKDKTVTGGIVQQTQSGATADKGTQGLVDQTLLASKASGEILSPQQNAVVKQLTGQ